MSEENKSDEVENGLGSGEQQSECCCSSDSSCCCGDTSEESGCCDPDASQDDPNTGKKKTVKIEYLYLDQTVCDRCQGTDTRVEKAIEELAPIMDMAGYKLKMKRVEISTKKLAKKHHDHALFIAFAPARNPRIALAVLVENGGFGAQAAAPVARQLIDYWLTGANSLELPPPKGVPLITQRRNR